MNTQHCTHHLEGRHTTVLTAPASRSRIVRTGINSFSAVWGSFSNAASRLHRFKLLRAKLWHDLLKEIDIGNE